MGQFKLEDEWLETQIGHIEKGTYVDFGAGDPGISNTWDLYKRGWRGLCLDAIEEEAAYVASVRPEDIVVACALGPWNGEVTILVHGGNTSIDSVRPYDIGHFKPRKVSCRRPMDVLSNWPQFLDKAIDFCSIDIEEAEQFVVPMIDWRRFRPNLMMIEITHDSSWEWAVLPFYEVAYTDGCNTFYQRKP